MMDKLPHIVGALEVPFDSLNREILCSLRQLAVMADQVRTLTEKIEDHAARLKGFDDTLTNLQQRVNL